MTPNYTFVYLALDKFRIALLCDKREWIKGSTLLTSTVCVCVGCDLNPVTALPPRTTNPLKATQSTNLLANICWRSLVLIGAVYCSELALLML